MAGEAALLSLLLIVGCWGTRGVLGSTWGVGARWGGRVHGCEGEGVCMCRGGHMHGCMHGWVGACTGGCMHGWVHAWVCRGVGVYVGVCTHQPNGGVF